MPKPLVFAHRGARCVAPENTLPAFQAALDMGVDGIELDVHLSQDGHLVVIHDFTVDKTSNGQGPVANFTAQQLAQLDAGSHFSPDFGGVGVPTLDQVLDLVADRCIVNIEIKTLSMNGGDQVPRVVKSIQQRKLHDQVIVSSFNPITLLALRATDAKIRLGLLYYEPMPHFLFRHWMGSHLNPEALHPYFGLIDGDLCDLARQSQKAVNTWTVNSVTEAGRLADLGVDVIMTDVPDQIMAALGS